MANDTEVFKKLTKARSALILDQPFFGALALRLRLIRDDSIPTLAVDGKRIYYNESFVRDLSLEHTKFIVAHEVMHCVYQHIGRRNGRNPKKWNMAGDYVINAVLKDAKFDMPPMGLFNPAFAGLSADAIYNQIPDMPDDGGSGTGDAGGPMCDIMDGDSDPADKAESQREWQIATVQAATAAKQASKLPGALERLIEDMMKPQIDWKARLRNFVSQITKDDVDWSRPNKKLIQFGLILPTLYSEAPGPIACFLDDSGSIDDKILNAFASEFRAIVEDVKPEITYLTYCDSEIAEGGRYEVKADEPLPEFKVHGGGGTDFRPPFLDLEERGIEPMCAIYLTDGYGPFPETPPPYPVMWVMTTDVIAPWGETIPIEVH